jgi:MFS family permease
MLPTSLLFLAAIALAAFAILVLAWAMFFALFTRRRVYGTVVVACGCLGGIGAMLLLLALSAIFGSFAHTPSFENWLLAFGAGFGLAGGVCAAVGLFSPLFSYNNRWSGRRHA